MYGLWLLIALVRDSQRVCSEISEMSQNRNRTVLLAENKIDTEKIKEKTDG
jgi:hypothetical protein